MKKIKERKKNHLWPKSKKQTEPRIVCTYHIVGVGSYEEKKQTQKYYFPRKKSPKLTFAWFYLPKNQESLSKSE